MKTKQRTIEQEKERLKTNIHNLTQVRYNYQQLVFSINQPKVYYLSLLPKISDFKIKYYSFYYDYLHHFRNEKNGLININAEVRKLHEDLRDYYKETADYFSELYKTAEEKAKISEMTEIYDVSIFSSKMGAQIFDAWYESNFRKKADYDFIFWALKKDGFLNEPITQTKFQEWLPDYNPEDPSLKIGRIESEIRSFNPKRLNNYNRLKQIIKG